MTELPAKFLRDGWVTFDLAGRELVDKVRRDLLSELRREYRQLADLESYHHQVTADGEHIAVQKRLFDWFVASGLGPEIVARNVDTLAGLVGPDLHVQARPYLRIARPEKPQDNVNVHRDTHYGGTPYELSVHLPFTDCGLDGSLGVISGSHLQADSAYPYHQIVDPTVERGSVKHQLGFTYAPKILREADIAKLRPTGTKVGQAMAFSLSLVHGQVVNRSPVTRFSADVRIVNSFAPIDWERNEATGYYRSLSRSPVTEAAQTYYRRNAGQE